MDSNAGNILGVFAFLTSSAGLIYAAVNHKRIRCRCCGRDVDMSVDVDPTDVPKVKPVSPEPSSAIAHVIEKVIPQEEEQEEEEEEVVEEEEYVPPKKSKKSRVIPV
jgi:hypothetical protein